MPEVSVIIPTMKGREEMLKKLLSTIPNDCEVIVVDDENLLLAAKRNKGARLATKNYLLFIDDDNYLKEDSIKRMMWQWDESIGVMGMVACYSDKKLIVADCGSGRSYLTGFTLGYYTNCNLTKIPKYLHDVSEAANAFMIRRDVFNDVGGFDEVNFPIDLDEADICKRIKDMGYRIVYNPRAVCYHKSQTYSFIPNFRRPLNAYFMGRNRVLFSRKHNNHCGYLIYLMFFMPMFVVFYCLSLLYKRNAKMIPHFLQGVFDGLRGCYKNKYQQG